MRKIFTTLGIVFLMLFSLAACNDYDLASYKTEAKAEIANYATKSNYCADNWSIICGIVDAGKTAVDAAESKAGVDAAVTTAKISINDVAPKEELILDEELENRIKVDYLQEFGHELYFGDEFLNKFYGLYNGAAVFFIAGENAALKTVTISGVEFSYNYGWKIWVWKDGIFYNLENVETIFEADILTQNDLDKIGIIHVRIN